MSCTNFRLRIFHSHNSAGTNALAIRVGSIDVLLAVWHTDAFTSRQKLMNDKLPCLLEGSDLQAAIAKVPRNGLHLNIAIGTGHLAALTKSIQDSRQSSQDAHRISWCDRKIYDVLCR